MSKSWVVNKTITIDATVAIVWKTLTDPELIRRWMSDYEINIISEWKVGSSIISKGDLHGINFENKGIILQFEPEKIFEYTFWSTLSEQADIPENYSVITFRLSPTGNKTTLIFMQKNFIAETTFKHSDFYWRVTLETIKKLIEMKNLLS
ncbi:MAG: SRPBCC family protein [Bacteroidia bacterium]